MNPITEGPRRGQRRVLAALVVVVATMAAMGACGDGGTDSSDGTVVGVGAGGEGDDGSAGPGGGGPPRYLGASAISQLLDDWSLITLAPDELVCVSEALDERVSQTDVLAVIFGPDATTTIPPDRLELVRGALSDCLDGGRVGQMLMDELVVALAGPSPDLGELVPPDLATCVGDRLEGRLGDAILGDDLGVDRARVIEAALECDQEAAVLAPVFEGAFESVVRLYAQTEVGEPTPALTDGFWACIGPALVEQLPELVTDGEPGIDDGRLYAAAGVCDPEGAVLSMLIEAAARSQGAADDVAACVGRAVLGWFRWPMLAGAADQELADPSDQEAFDAAVESCAPD